MISGAKILKIFLLIGSLLLAGCFLKEEQKPVIHELRGEVFGAYYIVKYRGKLDLQSFQNELHSFFAEFNAEFSTYQKNSIISEFNQLSVNTPMKVSSRYIEMLKLAQKFHVDSLGAFDPTLGPVIKLWGFGGGAQKKLPKESELKAALSSVGFEHVKWDEKNLTIWKTRPGLQLDINAFAPGWVSDLIGEMLRLKGIKHFMVDLSGEILFSGSKGQDGPWIAGIEKPSGKQGEAVHSAFKMSDQAISTSGNYRQFFTDQGVRKSHIIDPRTGRPVTHNISSASVIGSSGAETDAWSTVMMVLGTEGMALLEKNGMKVLLLEAKNPDSFEEILSPSMKRFIEANKL